MHFHFHQATDCHIHLYGLPKQEIHFHFDEAAKTAIEPNFLKYIPADSPADPSKGAEEAATDFPDAVAIDSPDAAPTDSPDAAPTDALANSPVEKSRFVGIYPKVQVLEVIKKEFASFDPTIEIVSSFEGNGMKWEFPHASKKDIQNIGRNLVAKIQEEKFPGLQVQALDKGASSFEILVAPLVLTQKEFSERMHIQISGHFTKERKKPDWLSKFSQEKDPKGLSWRYTGALGNPMYYVGFSFPEHLREELYKRYYTDLTALSEISGKNLETLIEERIGEGADDIDIVASDAESLIAELKGINNEQRGKGFGGSSKTKKAAKKPSHLKSSGSKKRQSLDYSQSSDRDTVKTVDDMPTVDENQIALDLEKWNEIDPNE